VKALRKAMMTQMEDVQCYRAGEVEIEIYLLGGCVSEMMMAC